jgi:hypothetical protein
MSAPCVEMFRCKLHKAQVFQWLGGLFTQTTQSSGPENIGQERPLSGRLAPRQVNSLSRTTLENNGKIRPEPDWEKLFNGLSGGEKGADVKRSLRLSYCFHLVQISKPRLAFDRLNRAGFASGLAFADRRCSVFRSS